MGVWHTLVAAKVDVRHVAEWYDQRLDEMRFHQTFDERNFCLNRVFGDVLGCEFVEEIDVGSTTFVQPRMHAFNDLCGPVAVIQQLLDEPMVAPCHGLSLSDVLPVAQDFRRLKCSPRVHSSITSAASMSATRAAMASISQFCSIAAANRTPVEQMKTMSTMTLLITVACEWPLGCA